MRKKTKTPLIIENLKIIDISSKGEAIARYNNIAIFIKNAVPGDICDVRVIKKRRKLWQGTIEKTHHYSERRIDPKCLHFQTCGGCKWQNMNYDSQLYFKEHHILNNLSKIGHLKLPENKHIIGSPKKYYYRNKMEFSFSNHRWLDNVEINTDKDIEDRNACGLHVSGMFNKVVDLKECHLQKDPSNEIRLSIKNFADKNNLTFFNFKKSEGLLRNLIIKTSTTNDLMVLIQFANNNKSKIRLVMNHLKSTFPNITSLLYIINKKANNTIYDQDIILYHGKDYIKEQIDGLTFRVGPKSFFQSNTAQAEILYKKIKELSKVKKNDIVYDLYTGTGTIAQYISKSCERIIGIDSVKEGIDAAKINAKENNLENCDFFVGDMRDILDDEFIIKNSKPDIIITNPPREGMHPKVVEQILRTEPKKIVYVSCNSSTQARDLGILSERYKITEIQPVDMFPQTHHVENIVIAELNS